MNANALFHPCLLYGHCYDWNQWKHYEKPIFVYKDCSNKCIEFFEKQDEDINRIKTAITKKFPEVNLDAVYPFKKWVDKTYGSLIADKSSLKASISSNIGLKSIKAPMKEIEKDKLIPDFKHRYFREDIPTGLLSIKDLAELAGVQTPCIIFYLFYLLFFIVIDAIMKWQ